MENQGDQSLLFPNENIDYEFNSNLSKQLLSMLKYICNKSDSKIRQAIASGVLKLEDAHDSDVILQPETVFNIFTVFKKIKNNEKVSDEELEKIFLLISSSLSYNELITEKLIGEVSLNSSSIILNSLTIQFPWELEGKYKLIFLPNKQVQIHNEKIDTIVKEKSGLFIIPEINIILDNSLHWVKEYLNHISEDVDKMLSVDEITLSQDTKQLLPNIRKGLDIVQNSWPEIYAEIKRQVKHLVVVDPPMSSSFADLNCHGAAVFVNHNYSPIWWAENLVHECSHIRLNSILAKEQHINNPYDYVKDVPWRKDPRPLIGIYHGCYVHSRMYILLLKMYRIDGKDEIKKRLQEVHKDLEIGLQSLRKHGNFNKTSLLIEMEETAKKGMLL